MCNIQHLSNVYEVYHVYKRKRYYAWFELNCNVNDFMSMHMGKKEMSDEIKHKMKMNEKGNG
jgi:hypothetical protein